MQTSSSSFSLLDPLYLYFLSFLNPPHPSYVMQKIIIKLFLLLSLRLLPTLPSGFQGSLVPQENSRAGPLQWFLQTEDENKAK